MRSILVLLVLVAFAVGYQTEDASPNPGQPGGPDALLDELDYIDLEAIGGSNRCVGVGFDGTNYWVTDAQNGGGALWIHIVSPAGTNVTTVDQYNTSGWGLRDMCWDGTYMFGSEDYNVDAYDNTYAYAGSYTCYASSPNRAQGFDGTYFYTGSFDITIYQVDWDGTFGSNASYVVWSTAVANGGLYGLAYDAYNDCMWASTASYDNQIYQIDMTGALIQAWTYNLNIAGGCTPGELDGHPGQQQLCVLEQGSPDALHIYEAQPVALERDTWAGIKTLF
jgi:hypothetical protein